MTEGGISEWKKKVGESFSAGDVLLEIVREVPVVLDKRLHVSHRKRTRLLLTWKPRMMV
jgi:hypothetical protein